MVPAAFRPAGNEPPVRMNVERPIHLPTCSDRSVNNVAIRSDRVLSYSNSAGEMLKKGFSTVVGAARCGNRALACVSESCHCGPGQEPRRYESFCLNTRCPSVELRAAGCTLLPNELSDVVWLIRTLL